MTTRLQAAAFGAILAFFPVAAFATAEEVAGKAASATNKGLTKTENGVKHGLQKAAGGIERGGAATGRAVSKTAKKLGLPASSASASSVPMGDVKGKQE